MPPRDHLRIAGHPAPTVAPGCRSSACSLRAEGALGYCAPCEAVYHAARYLREQLLGRRRARLHAAHRALFDVLPPAFRERLLTHMAAQTAQRGRTAHVFDEHGLEDFLAELHDLGLTQGLT